MSCRPQRRPEVQILSPPPRLTRRPHNLMTCARSSTDRASDYGSEGWGFESLRARHQKPFPAFRGASVGSLTTLLTTVVSPLAHGRWPLPCRAKRRIHARNRGTLNLFDHIDIRSCRHRNRAMKQNALHRCCLDTHREQQRGTRMPKVVEPDASHISSSTQRSERSVDVLRLERRPVLRCEYQTESIGPCDLRITELVTPMAPQELPRQRHGGGRRFGFHVPQGQVCPHTRERLPNNDPSIDQVHINPPKPERRLQAVPVVSGVVASGAGAMIRRRRSSGSLMEARERASVEARETGLWVAARSLTTVSLCSPPARMVSMLPGPRRACFPAWRRCPGWPCARRARCRRGRARSTSGCWPNRCGCPRRRAD